MDIILTYTTALEALRQPDYLDLADAWDERTGAIPERVPTAAQLRRIIDETPLLKRLSRPLHLLVSTDDTSHSSELFTRHVSRTPHPPSSFVRIGRNVLVASPELLPLQMARVCSRTEEALLMSELCGLYSIGAEEGSDMQQRSRALTTKAAIRLLLSTMPGAHGSRRVRATLPPVIESSGSPYETKLALRLRAPVDMGGYGLEIASMNEGVMVSPIERRLEELQLRKPDILLIRPRRKDGDSAIGFTGVAVDYKGRVHDAPEVAVRDDRRRNELLAHGIKPYEIRKAHYDDLDYMDSLVRMIRRDLGLPAFDPDEGRPVRMQLYLELERIDGHHWSGPKRASALEPLGL